MIQSRDTEGGSRCFGNGQDRIGTAGLQRICIALEHKHPVDQVITHRRNHSGKDGGQQDGNLVRQSGKEKAEQFKQA